ncbi:hypothetical protein NPA07_01265 [Mycoplasmopsis caviae]|nr:hypothetical protein [Mycoplasmopsis caviae]UUD35487.1 hypothetical protein NPA07_01265 [Mycoplasmopsis caviae]
MIAAIILASVKNSFPTLTTTGAIYVAIVAFLFFISLVGAIIGTTIISIIEKKELQCQKGGK